jgi:TDG/mug DNA glycosylase family protein
MAYAGRQLTRRAVGFPPIEPAAARVLILGSLPGAASIEKQEYYAHPRNAFWPIVGRLLEFAADAPYVERVAGLTAARIALWDVCYSAVRAGSLDSAIESGTPQSNDIGGLLTRQPGIDLVLFNGSTAASLFRRLVAPSLTVAQRNLQMATLPSTSPAHAARTFEQKLRAWRVALAGC